MDYSSTVNLPKTDFPMKADLPKREPGFLAQWEKDRLYQKGVAQRLAQKGKKQFILHDGPPYANGNLHVGHALNKILKDMIVRFKTMAGFYAPYVPGWDCHGLPIELQLMKELKVDKHKVQREQFRQQASAFAQKFVDLQREEFKRMGVLGDWENPYLTMAPGFKETIVESFRTLEREGYVYRGKKPVYWCYVDETALAEAEVEYENDPGPSIYVAFPMHAPPNFNEDVGGHGSDRKAELWTSGSVSYVIWTTTPWTLPANMAIAINPDEFYVLFEDAATKKKYILAERRLESVQQVCKLEGQVLDRIPGHTFRDAFARHPWIENHLVPVLAAGFVAMDAGTGIVHIAPGHGREDYQLGSVHDLEVLSPVDDRGRFTDDVPRWKGEHVFKANPLIIEFLKSIGALLHSEEITHSYPHCWRCHKPVIFRATEQWFMNIDHKHLRDRLLKAINGVEWIPAYGKNRITGMVEARPDWCLSRQRLWGTEIPGESASADPDIFDVWFESGVSWAAVLKQRPELSFPADMYLEGSDQHRGWFQTSLIPSVALEDKAPYKQVLTHGFVMDGDGRPMSKSLGNTISPQDIIKQYGADVLRLWVAASDYGGDVRLSPEILSRVADMYRKVRNTFRYLLGNLTDFSAAQTVPFDKLAEIDQWALSKLQEEVVEARAAYDRFEFHRVSSRLVSFCATTLSGFYLDVLKDRLYCEAPNSVSRRGAQTVVWHMADHLARLWAPILSFTADEVWRTLGHSENVHLSDLPVSTGAWTLPSGRSRLDEVLPLRDLVPLAIEKVKGKVIKGNPEARLTIYSANENMVSLLKHYQGRWPEFFLVSQVELSPKPLTDSELDSNGLQIKVERTTGQRCARCYLYKTDLGHDARWPDICTRCATVVDALAKSGAAVPSEVKG